MWIIQCVGHSWNSFLLQCWEYLAGSSGVSSFGLSSFTFFLNFIFLRANIKWCAYRKNSRWLGANPINEVLIVSAVTAAISFFNPYTRKSASALIKQVKDEKYIV